MKRSSKWMFGLGAPLGLLAILSACPSDPVTVNAPVQTATQLDAANRLSFQRVTQLRNQEGKNLVAHEAFSDPSILYENGKYRMWFTVASKADSNDREMGVAHAESDDGVVWQVRLDSSGEPELLLKPTPGGWDSGGIETPAVVKAPDGRYFLYYSGDVPPKGSHSWAIGFAVSNDGFSWTKVGDGPVVDGRGDWEGPFFEGSGSDRKRVGGVNEPSVLYDSEQQIFKMWYSALGERTSKLAFRIGYATSTDGISWEKQPDPVFEPDANGAWDDTIVSHTNVVFYPGHGYHLFYFGTSAQNYQLGERNGAVMMPGSIGHAFSTDGLQWKRDANPVLSVVPGTWEAWTVGGPTCLIQQNEIKLWYFATAVHDKFSFRMGFAKAELPQGSSSERGRRRNPVK